MMSVPPEVLFNASTHNIHTSKREHQKPCSSYKHPVITLLIDDDRNLIAPRCSSKQTGNLPAEGPNLEPQVPVIHEFENAPISNPQLVIDCKVLPPSIKAPYGATTQVPHLPPPASACQHDTNISIWKVRVEAYWHCLKYVLPVQVTRRGVKVDICDKRRS